MRTWWRDDKLHYIGNMCALLKQTLRCELPSAGCECRHGTLQLQKGKMMNIILIVVVVSLDALVTA
jgi:hypothetical protein